MSNKNFLYGGQAVIEGVMIRGMKRATLAVRKPNGDIVKRSIPLESWANSKLRNFFFIRGILVLLETLIIGTKALTYSASEAAEEDDNSEMSKFAIIIMISFSLLFGLSFFFLLPLFLSSVADSIFSNHFLSNIIEGIIRLILFLGYIFLIGRMNDIKRVFGYHGAEHMTVHCMESNKSLLFKNIINFSPAHPRCGTSFLLTVVFFSILIFILLPREPVWFLVSSRIFLIPIIASISYEFIRFTGKYDNFLTRILSLPNLLLQKLTTNFPDKEMIDVSIVAMEYAIAIDKDEVTPEDSKFVQA
ncbi:MAG: DUF1385 domain-containing protein [Dehalococcoidia bacterium]